MSGDAPTSGSVPGTLSERPARGGAASAGWLRGTLAAVFLVVLSQVVYAVAALVRLALGSGTAPVLRGAIACAVGGALAAAAIWAVLRLLRRRGWPASTYGFRLPRRTLSSVAIFIALTVALAPLSLALTQLLGLHGTTAIDLRKRSESTMIFISFVAVVLAPWFEEVSMRGVLLWALDRRVGFWPAASLSGLVWAGAHGAGGVLVVFTVEGALLAWLRRRTGSLLPGLALHGAWNGVAIGSSGAGALAPALVAVLGATVAAAALAVRRHGALDAPAAG